MKHKIFDLMILKILFKNILSFYFSFADSSSSLCVLVSTVGKLCRLINEDVTEKVMQVLGPEDFQRYLFKKKVAKYDPEYLEW